MSSPTPDKITVNGDRLWQSLMDLAEIGAYDDERTGLRGVNRLVLTDADAAGRREGTDPTAAPVRTGSDIDSVATAGSLHLPRAVPRHLGAPHRPRRERGQRRAGADRRTGPTRRRGP